jgi:exopolyphosphatase/guanosine-5'-triphosphate,3'-diphosphate pyrophosphatase
MNQRIGIIDLGSNTTRLIIMAYEPGCCFHMTDEVREIVRLAEGVGDHGTIQPAAMYRAVEALKMFHALCRATGVQRIIATGTSALRDAPNKDEFLQQLKDETDLDLRVLSDEEEAYYGYLGVVNSMPIDNGFVIDIGGGSTEITEVDARQFRHWVSQPVGIVRLTERYVNSDPISNKEFRALNNAVTKTFEKLDWFHAASGRTLVGIGGTVRNLARIDQKRRKYPLERLHGYKLSLETLENIVAMLRKKTVSERANVSGLNSDRADVIIAGAVILLQLMKQGGFEEIQIGGQGLREGLFYEHFLQDRKPPLFDNVREASVYNLARLYDYEATHADKVRELSLSLFDQLQPLHGYGSWEREILGAAALLHDIGVQVGYYDHHKHSAYILLNTGLPGFNHREVALLTVLVRAHRKGDVKTGDYKAVLERDDTTRAEQLSALLRLAEYLERSKSQVVRRIEVAIEDAAVRLLIHADGDPIPEIWNASRRASLFEHAFGRSLEIIEASVSAPSPS